MRLWSIVIVLCGICSALSGRALAQEKSEVILDKFFELEYTPSRAIWFVQSGDQTPGAYEGVILPAVPGTAPGERLLWMTAVHLESLSQQDLKVAILVEGEAGQLHFFEPYDVSLEEPARLAGSADKLRELLLQRKQLLQSWSTQEHAQAESLDRLRADAQTIAKVGRIISVQDEIKRMELSMKALERDIENLKRFLELVKNWPAPKNYVKRELELTQQLSELTRLAKEAEAGELGRRSAAQSELQRKIEIIEATRFENLEALESRLAALQSRGGPTHSSDADETYGNQRVN